MITILEPGVNTSFLKNIQTSLLNHIDSFYKISDILNHKTWCVANWTGTLYSERTVCIQSHNYKQKFYWRDLFVTGLLHRFMVAFRVGYISEFVLFLCIPLS